MRAYWIATAAIATVMAMPAGAQTTVRHGGGWSRPGPGTAPRPTPQRWNGGTHRMQPRWGGRVGGRWYAGVYAPGGWTAYRRPVRGWVLPRYWFAPTFFINDYGAYGLGAPPQGYNWTRYYDDAVLVDGSGHVYDSVTGVNWDGRDDGPDVAYDDHGPDGPPPPPGANYAPPAPPPPQRERHDDGVGGAVVGAVVGGVAGNVIAGRGDKLGGTLIGAGVGAIAGAAIDQAEDHHKRRRLPPPPDRGPYPGHYGYPAEGYGPPPVVYAPPAEVVQGYGYDHHHGYDRRGYAGHPQTTVIRGPYGSVTTVTVIPAVTTTTTTTEYVYEAAPVRYRTVRKVRSCNCKYVRR